MPLPPVDSASHREALPISNSPYARAHHTVQWAPTGRTVRTYATVLALLNTRNDGLAELSTFGSHCSLGAHAALAGTIRLIGTVEVLAIRTG